MQETTQDPSLALNESKDALKLKLSQVIISKQHELNDLRDLKNRFIQDQATSGEIVAVLADLTRSRPSQPQDAVEVARNLIGDFCDKWGWIPDYAMLMDLSERIAAALSARPEQPAIDEVLKRARLWLQLHRSQGQDTRLVRDLVAVITSDLSSAARPEQPEGDDKEK